MKKYFDYIVGVFIFLCASFYIPGQNFHDSQHVLFKISVLLLFTICLYFKPIRSLKNIYVNSFLVLSILSFFFNKDSQAVAIASLVDVTLVVMFFYILLNHLENTSVIYNSIIAVIAINTIMVITQFFKIDPLCLNDVRETNTHLVGLFGHPMNLGAYMSTVLPYVWHKNKWFGTLAGALVFASGSWAAILCGIIGMSVYLWFKNRKLMIISLSIVLFICSVLMIIVYPSLSPAYQGEIIKKITLRIYTQYPLLKVAMTNPYFGYGLGTFRYILPQVKEVDWGWLGGVDVTWNDFLGCALEIGFASVFIFFGIIRKAFREFLRSQKSLEEVSIFASLATIPIGAFFHSYMNYMNIGIICLALYSLWEIKRKEFV